MWDLEKNKVRGRYQFPELVSLLSPQWMPDGQSIVLSGLSESGVSDLYRVHLPERHARAAHRRPLPGSRPHARAPTAAASCSPPTATADGLRRRGQPLPARPRQRPDRAAHGRQLEGRVAGAGRRTDGSTSPPTATACSTSSRWTPLGDGRRETSAWSGAFDGVPLPDGSGLLVGGFHDLSWNLYRYPGGLAGPEGAVRAGAARHRRRLEPGSPPGDTAGSVDREPRALPLAAHARLRRRRRGVIPGYGGAQGIFFVMSDLLGDNLLFGSLGSFQGRRLGSILSQHQRQRGLPEPVPAGQLGLRRLPDQEPELRGRPGRRLRRDRLRRASALLRYPLSRFSRIEGTVVAEHSDRVDFTLPVDEPRRVGWIASHFLSYVHDNSLWIHSGPIDGGRFAVYRRASPATSPTAGSTAIS